VGTVDSMLTPYFGENVNERPAQDISITWSNLKTFRLDKRPGESVAEIGTPKKTTCPYFVHPRQQKRDGYQIKHGFAKNCCRCSSITKNQEQQMKNAHNHRCLTELQSILHHPPERGSRTALWVFDPSASRSATSSSAGSRSPHSSCLHPLPVMEGMMSTGYGKGTA